MPDCTKCTDEERKHCDELRDQLDHLDPGGEGGKGLICPKERPAEMPENHKAILMEIVGAFKDYQAKVDAIKEKIKAMPDEESLGLQRLLEFHGGCRSLILQATLLMPENLMKALNLGDLHRQYVMVLGEVVPNVMTAVPESLTRYMEVDQMLVMNSINALTEGGPPQGMVVAMRISQYLSERIAEAYGEQFRQYQQFCEGLAKAIKERAEEIWANKVTHGTPPARGGGHGAN